MSKIMQETVFYDRIIELIDSSMTTINSHLIDIRDEISVLRVEQVGHRHEIATIKSTAASRSKFMLSLGAAIVSFIGFVITTVISYLKK